MNNSIVQTLREVQLKDIVWTDRNLSKMPFHTAFWVQKRIGGAIAAHAHLAHGVLLDVGCGLKPYEKFLRRMSKNITARNTRPKAGFAEIAQMLQATRAQCLLPVKALTRFSARKF